MKQHGFTVIELIIVIALLGALAVGILMSINPLQFFYQRTDAQVKLDIAREASAMKSYFVTKQYYPGTINDLITSGDLGTVPSAPIGYSPYTFTVAPDGCTTEGENCIDVAIGGQIKAPVQQGVTMWCWHSNTGVASESATCLAP
jgi:prepilin-type N-terminal cleavage/methylation domain-containing protein